MLHNKVQNKFPEGWKPIRYSGKIIDKVHDNTYLTEFCNQDFKGEVTGYGSELVIRTRPGAKIRPYIPGTPVVPYRSVSEPLTVKVGRSWESTPVVDDWEKINTDIKGWEDEQSDDRAVAAAEYQEAMWFKEAPTFAAPQNQGANAGRYGLLDLGTLADPIRLLTDNSDYKAKNGGKMATMDVVKFLLRCDVVFSENEGASKAAKRFMPLNPRILNLVRTNDTFVKASASGEDKTALRKDLRAVGQLGLGGFGVYMSNHIAPVAQKVEDGVTYNVFAIPFGDTRAVTYSGLFDKTQILWPDDTPGICYESHVGCFDWWPVMPQYFGVAYVAL